MNFENLYNIITENPDSPQSNYGEKRGYGPFDISTKPYTVISFPTISFFEKSTTDTTHLDLLLELYNHLYNDVELSDNIKMTRKMTFNVKKELITYFSKVERRKMRDFFANSNFCILSRVFNELEIVSFWNELKNIKVEPFYSLLDVLEMLQMESTDVEYDVDGTDTVFNFAEMFKIVQKNGQLETPSVETNDVKNIPIHLLSPNDKKQEMIKRGIKPKKPMGFNNLYRYDGD